MNKTRSRIKILTSKKKLTIARWLQRIIMIWRRLFGKRYETQVVRGGIRWQIDLHEGIDFGIFFFGVFEYLTTGAYKKIVKSDSVVVDIGANLGAHVLRLAKLVGDGGRVIAIEPTDYAFSKLQANLALNPQLSLRVLPIQAFLGANSSDDPPASLYAKWPLSPGEDSHEDHYGKLADVGVMETRTLDNLLSELNPGKIDFMKIDVDGYEAKILQGSERILKNDRPIIILELAPSCLRECGSSVEELLEVLVGNDYELLDIVCRKPLPKEAESLENILAQGSSCNILAWPSELFNRDQSPDTASSPVKKIYGSLS